MKLDDLHGQQVTCHLDELHPHPSYARHQRRILLALELEPWFKEKARSNLRAGGQNKGSSKLTEAESWMSGPKLPPP